MERAFAILAWFVAAALIAAACAVFVVSFLIGIRLVPASHEGDLGTWSGALFTALAFAGTIYLANSQERVRRREARVRGLIVLPTLIGQTVQIHAGLQGIVRGLENWAESGEKSDDGWKNITTECLDILDGMPSVAREDLQYCVGVSHECAGQMNSVLATLHTARKHLSLAVNAGQEHWEEDTKFAHGICAECAQASDELLEEFRRHFETRSQIS